MARVNNLTNFVTDVATAIKTKSEISTKIKPKDFDTLIMNIQTGVDISDSTVTAEDVAYGKVFYTSDGTRTVGTYIPEDLDQTITDLENEVERLRIELANKMAGPITEPEYYTAIEQVENLLGKESE